MLTLLTLLACTGDDPSIKALKPDIVVNPEVLDYGQVVVEYSSPGYLSIINAGYGTLEIDAVTLDGTGASAFTLGEVAAEVEHDGTFELPITFLPQDPGLYTATLTIDTNDEEKPSVSVALTGEGIVAPTPHITCDPLSLDFGTVPALTPSTLWFSCVNTGDDDLYISDVSQTESGAFLVVGDPTGYTLPPDQELLLIVMYTPTSDAGDNGTITLTTNDPTTPETTLHLVGNGGGDFEYPVAIINGPASAVPRETITLDGSDSYDPNGYELVDYIWTVTGPYDEVVTTEIGTDLYAQLDLAGEYEVRLQVENSIGLLSAPAVYRVDVIPDEELHVELVWTELPDLDLHLVAGDGEMFLDPYDCNYCNRNPEWGVVGASDNPSLDLDAWSTPPGVENINIDTPADDTYSVKVHYFEDNGGGDVTATVNIYVYGVLEGSFSRVLSRNKVWDVAQIQWPAGYVIEQDEVLYTPTRRTCE